MSRERDSPSKQPSESDPAGAHDDIGRLLRMAGARPPIPDERNARIEASVRAQWRTTVGSRQRWGRVGLASAVAAGIAAALTLFLASPPPRLPMSPPAPSYEIVEVVGVAMVDGRPVARGDRLGVGAVITTTADSRVAVRLAPGRTLRLDRASVLEARAAGDLLLRSGRVYIDSSGEGGEPRASGRPLRVATQHATIEEIGTQFEVGVGDAGVDVRLREGVVIVHRDHEAHELHAGTQLSVDRGGVVTRRAIPIHGPDWEWLGDVTPMPTLEGLTAHEFLLWIARERGFELKYDAGAIEAAARATRLAGAIPGVRVEDALDVVLPTCRLAYRIDEGQLRVRSAESP